MAFMFKEKPKETERKLRANDAIFNSKFNYANNFIRTSKYNLITFLPLNLFEQFKRLANFYFLCLLMLQFCPYISSVPPYTTAVPLIIVLSLTALKDAIDGRQRHKSDIQVNNRLSKVLRNGELVYEKWFRVQVGDIVLMENDNFVVADLLLLSTSEPNGLCYVETADLDGETNLKCRQALPETAEFRDNIQLIRRFKGEMICEPPNNNLTKFEGTLLWNNKSFSVDNDKIVLRGCRLRNTKWCFGIVIFAGKDTKLRQNSGQTVFKRTTLDRLLNLLIIGIVFFLICMCLTCAIASGFWEDETGQSFRAYLPGIHDHSDWGATVFPFLGFFCYVIVLNTLVPISLYVSVEVIRICHSLLINWDKDMYDPTTDTAAKARTTTLSEELGQIQYIFSDKTGTLTQNIMTFNKCSIMGKSYGDVFDKKTREPLEITDDRSVDFSANPMYEKSFKFYDQSLLDEVNNGNEHVQEFFRLLALCHTVMSDVKEGKLEYQAQSPDEAALTSAARNFGFVFKSRTPSSITIQELNKLEVYELLDILDFNNVRKRMSVIIRKNEKITLYCKGADTVIFERLSPSSAEIKLDTDEHLDMFAGEGLRTLCLAKRELDPMYYEKWKEHLHEASTSLQNREAKVDLLYEEIEQNLELMGATAIEDKLQDGVPQCIANLAAAGIKLWILTGDKQETAINIGYSCQLLTDEMEENIFTIEGQKYDDVENELKRCRENIANVKSHNRGAPHCSVVTFRSDSNANDKNNNNSAKVNIVEPFGVFALVINGHSLVHALKPEMESLFLEVASNCKAVICCRVTPLQKALVVDLVKRHKKAVTLAIGDGANDLSMIKKAHIGVGISGQEGMQAVLSSDFSIGQFRFLERLLLVHGRWSYYRMSKFLRYFFYKNFAFTLCHLWYAYFCEFSAQILFDDAFMLCYNVFYTSLPVLALGIFDQDVDDRSSLRYPLLYTTGQHNLLFNKIEFFKSLLHGIFASLVIFFITYGSFNDAIGHEGLNLDGHQIFGTVVSTLLVLVVTAQIALETYYWTIFNHLFIWGSLALYFLITFILHSDLIYQYFGYKYLGCIRMALSSSQFWLTAFLVLVVLILPVVAKRFYHIAVHPTLSDRCRYKKHMSRLKAQPSKPQKFLRSNVRRIRRSQRSGYGFSHQEGFGRLITSGKMIKTNSKSNLS